MSHPFDTADQLLDICRSTGWSFSDVVLANERAWRPEAEVRAGLLEIWAVMQDTIGAAGIIPAVLKYYVDFVPGADDDGVVRFLLAATAIGSLFKKNASISGAEVGCQGEVGSAYSMAARANNP